MASPPSSSESGDVALFRVPNSKGAQKLIDHIIGGFEGIHQNQNKLLESLVGLLKEEQCVRQEAVIRQQCAQIMEMTQQLQCKHEMATANFASCRSDSPALVSTAVAESGLVGILW